MRAKNNQNLLFVFFIKNKNPNLEERAFCKTLERVSIVYTCFDYYATEYCKDGANIKSTQYTIWSIMEALKDGW